MKNILKMIAKMPSVIKVNTVAIFKKVVHILTWKRVLITCAVLGVACLIFMGIGGGSGGGSGENEGDGNIHATEHNQYESEESGDEYLGEIIAVTVAGNDYFFQNGRIELESLVNELKAVEGAFIVEIKDDSASLKAYNALITKLDNLHIQYVEK